MYDKTSLTEIQANMKADKNLKDLAQSYHGVDISQTEHLLSKDRNTMEILAQKSVYEDLMKGEVVQVRNVSINHKGQPRHFFGFSLFHLNRQTDSVKPVLNVSFSAPALNQNNEETIKAQSLTAKPGYTDEIQKALSKATDSVSAEYAEETKEISDIMSQPIAPLSKAIELKKSLTNIADWYFESDANKRTEFLAQTESLFTLSYKQGVIVKNPQGGADGIHSREQQILLSDLPMNHKGVPITEKQVKKLLSGHSITLVAEPGTEAEGSPEAKVKFNPVAGKLVEIDERVVQLSLENQPKHTFSTESPSMKRRI